MGDKREKFEEHKQFFLGCCYSNVNANERGRKGTHKKGLILLNIKRKEKKKRGGGGGILYGSLCDGK